VSGVEDRFHFGREKIMFGPLMNLKNGAEAKRMSDHLNHKLPDTLKNIRSRPLFVMHLEVKPLLIAGSTPDGYRRIGVVPEGSFEGDRLSGRQTLRHDGSVVLNVRLVLQTNDNALVCMTYQGVRHGPPDVIARLEGGEIVDPESYYFRINPLFQTSAPQYDWINRVVGIGLGHRLANGPIYSVFELL
jgi:Protein of unknown function (DUF3237)